MITYLGNTEINDNVTIGKAEVKVSKVLNKARHEEEQYITKLDSLITDCFLTFQFSLYKFSSNLLQTYV